MPVALDRLAPLRAEGTPRGVVSVCSAHPLVLRAALRRGATDDETVLIEATCNQVNHEGGYTGMRPADFAALVRRIADEEGCPADRVVLGGDHLGPNPWRDRPADEAMDQALRMVGAYSDAGFTKIHLDASMGCAGEPEALDDATTAERAAALAAAAGPEATFIIGTEVPPPGGADHTLDSVPPTSPDAARQTVAVHREVFARHGIDFDRVIGVVVQPGVEFGNRNVVRYDRAAARPLVGVLDDEPGLVFEAHSTDYQGTLPLADLVRDGFAILKVGPELTFALREALYALDLIASDLVPDYGDRPLMRAMETVMRDDPAQWARHYGDGDDARLLRHYSLSDRIRYYWPARSAGAAVARLTEALSGRRIPLPLLWQHAPWAEAFADAPLDCDAFAIARITRTLDAYHAACAPEEETRP